jgi:hypothetical protein
MSRNGKIAHLPGLVRDQLNQRLENGEESPTLLPWLNALPKVQECLKDSFNSVPINKQNLSEWRLGGFREWQMREELILQARRLSESAEEMENHLDTPLLPGALAGALAARYAALLNSWDGEPDPKFEEKLRLLRGLNRDIALLQKTMQQANRQKREQVQAEEDNDQRIIEQVKNETVAPIWAMIERDEIMAVLGAGERNRKIAEILTAVKYDLPQPRQKEAGGRKKEESGRTQAKSRPRRQTSQAQSGPVKPDSLAERTPEASSEPQNRGDKD